MRPIINPGYYNKKLRIKESNPKTWDLKFANNFFNNTNTFENTQKESKKRFQKEKHKQKNSSFGTPTNGYNTISNKTGPKTPKKNLSAITYYNCNKKRHYAKICLKLKKNNILKN